MNKVYLSGRLTKDVETRYSQGEKSMAISRYTLAVDRKGKDNGADFINCVAFDKQGEFAEKYLRKGMKILISGHIQTGSYEGKNGKVYTTDVVVDEHEFCESKQTDAPAPQKKAEINDGGWMDIPDIADELPFN